MDPLVDINQHTFFLTPKDEAASKGGLVVVGLIDSQFVLRPLFQLLLSNRSPYN